MLINKNYEGKLMLFLFVLRGVVQTDDQHYVSSPPANGDK